MLDATRQAARRDLRIGGNGGGTPGSHRAALADVARQLDAMIAVDRAARAACATRG